ncbi:MAG: GNAT family N-acetyltransferase [Candidatus Buchananbacteria bacterium]
MDNKEQAKLEGMCIHGNFPPCDRCLQTSAEKKSEIPISIVDPKNKQAIADYYQFEIDQGFSTINPKSTFEKMIDFRQKQIHDNKLAVAVIKEDDKVVATGVVVLENGTMGRELTDDEAGAGGVVVSGDKRNSGLGEVMAQQQIQMAQDSGKKSIVSRIDQGNNASFRLHLKLGYQMEDIRREADDSGHEKIDYKIRKSLTEEVEPQAWAQAVASGQLAEAASLDNNSPKSVLIDPNNDQLIEKALAQGYKGVYLLRPKDLSKKDQLNQDYFVFSK